MGFGIFFIGYFFTFVSGLSNVYFFADIIGALLMLYSFTKLAQYNTYYKGAFGACVLFILLCGTGAADLALHFMPETASLVLNGVKLAVVCVMTVVAFLGARGISEGAGADKLVRTAERQTVMTVIYYIVALAVLAFGSLIGNAAGNYINTVLLVYYIVMLLLNLVFIYKCFGILCPADEDDTQPKKSRFALINKMNETIDSIETGTKKYGEDSIRLAINETKKLEERDKNAHTHKKKKK